MCEFFVAKVGISPKNHVSNTKWRETFGPIRNVLIGDNCKKTRDREVFLSMVNNYQCGDH